MYCGPAITFLGTNPLAILKNVGKERKKAICVRMFIARLFIITKKHGNNLNDC